MIFLVVSDFHLGKGPFLKNGQLNILEDFFEDERFAEFLDYYSSGTNYLSNIHLVFNGDTLNLVQVDVDGVYNYIIDSSLVLNILDSIIQGHPVFFNALKSFLAKPNKKLTFILGNHDIGMEFKEAQDYFKAQIGSNIEFKSFLEVSGIRIEHGHRLETHNTTVGSNFIQGPNGKTILNLSWGNLFNIILMPKLKKERPYIDKVRPMQVYVKWCLIHDFRFFIRVLWMMFKYFLSANLSSCLKQNRSLKYTLKLFKQITLFPSLSKMAQTILKDNPSLHTVIMGHSHISEWRKFPEKKFYFNTGTWNSISSMDISMHENIQKLTYVTIELHKEGEIKDISLKTWKGKWRPFRQETGMFD